MKVKKDSISIFQMKECGVKQYILLKEAHIQITIQLNTIMEQEK